MLIYEPVKVLAQIGPVKIFAWGLMVAIGFLTASFLILKEAERKKFNKDRVVNLIVYSIISAFVGSRIVFVLAELPYYLQYPLDIFKIWDGGVVSYGGVIFGVLTAYLYLKAKKESFLKYGDLLAPFIPLGFAIGRIGCFLNWCCYGAASSLPWALSVAGDVARHPTQLYLLIINLVIFAILVKLRDRKFFKKTVGSVFFAYLLLYSVFRLLIEPLRQYHAPEFHGIAYLVLTLGVIISVVFFIIKRKRYKNK